MMLKIKVTPNAKQNAIVGFQGDILKIKLHATPEKGKANELLIEFLSKELRIPKSNIRILSGHTSRLKKVEIQGVDSLNLPSSAVVLNKNF